MKAPLRRPISPENPVLILQRLPVSDPSEEAQRMVMLWKRLDPVIRTHASVQIGRHLPERNRTVLSAADKAGITITLQVQGNNGERHDTMPLDETRRLVEAYPCIVGLEIAEASQRTFVGLPVGPEYAMGRNARYARDAIRLCGECGLFLAWQLLWDNFLAVGCSSDNEALFTAVREYGENVIPMHEMNAQFGKLAAHTGAMGIWASGATANWGVEAQSWYWHDAGYDGPGACFPGTIEMPGALYAIMFLLGASAGATAYAVEPPRDIWPGEEGAHRFAEWMAPVFSRLVLERLIPTREQVLATMPVAYHLPRCRRPAEYRTVLDDLDMDHGEGRLARAAYGVFDRSREAELIPNSPRYNWIPALPTETPPEALNRFRRVLRPGEFATQDEARAILDDHFPVTDRGEAWSLITGPLAVAANTHENWFLPETVKLAVPRRPTDVRIAMHGGQYMLLWEPRTGDRAYRVWRLRDGVEEITGETREPGCTLDDPQAGDRYAVGAVTGEREEFDGALHLHDFLVFSMRESRLSPWIALDGSVVERPRIGETIRAQSAGVVENERRCAVCSPVEDLASTEIVATDPHRATKHAVVDAIFGWKRAIEAEDIAAIVACYDSEYREPDGRTAESVGVAFRSIFWRCLQDRAGSVAADWGAVYAWRCPVVRIFIRDWREVTPDLVAVDTVAAMWAGGGPEMEPSDMFAHPWARSPALRMTWRRSPDARWLLLRTEPPFLTMEDIAIFRWCYQGW